MCKNTTTGPWAGPSSLKKYQKQTQRTKRGNHSFFFSPQPGFFFFSSNISLSLSNSYSYSLSLAGFLATSWWRWWWGRTHAYSRICELRRDGHGQRCGGFESWHGSHRRSTNSSTCLLATATYFGWWRRSKACHRTDNVRHLVGHCYYVYIHGCVLVNMDVLVS
jgi:hypothetical protein